MVNSTNLGEFVQSDYDMSRVVYIDLVNLERPREWICSEFESAADSIANGLLRRGLSRGSRVAVMAANGANFIQAYLAIMRTGMVAVPINFKLAKKTIQYIFEDAAIEIAFVDAERAHLCPSTCPIINFDEAAGESSFADFLTPGSFESVAPATGDIAEILYTSGSTGRPKGVLLDHAGQKWALHVLMDLMKANIGSRTLIVAPCYHMNGLFLSLLQLNIQGTIVSLPKFDPATYIDVVSKYQCTSLSGVPTMFAMVARLDDDIKQLDLSCVTSVAMGSAPVTPELLNQVKAIFPNALIRNVYGTTEAGPAVFGPHPDGIAAPISSLGYPIEDVELKLVGGPSSNEGVLFIKAPALMAGYRNLPDVTAEKLIDGWYDTGDEMRRDDDEFYYFVGRADDMFVCGGENIHPGEVEKMLAEHKDVAQVAVVPVADEMKGYIPITFIVKRPGSNPGEEDIRAFAIENGPAYSHPRFVFFRESIPLGGTQKVDRRQLIEEGEKLTATRRQA